MGSTEFGRSAIEALPEGRANGTQLGSIEKVESQF